MDSASEISSITNNNRNETVSSSGFGKLFSGGNLTTIVHILSEITVFVAMGMWVRGRTNSLQKQINDLRDIVEQQTEAINQHTELLQVIMASRGEPAKQQPQPQQQPSFTPPPSQPTGVTMDFLTFTEARPIDKPVETPVETTAEPPRVEMLSPPTVPEPEPEPEQDDSNTGPSSADLDAELAAELDALE